MSTYSSLGETGRYVSGRDRLVYRARPSLADVISRYSRLTNQILLSRTGKQY